MGSGTGEKKFASLEIFNFVKTVDIAKSFNSVQTIRIAKSLIFFHTICIAKSFSSIQTVGNAKMQTVGIAKMKKSFISSEWKIPVRKTMPTAALL